MSCLSPCRRIQMTRLTLLSAAALLAALTLAPDLAQARTHHHRYHHALSYALPYQISYNHNYGPGPLSGTLAHYYGPSTNHFYQCAAPYLGQDRRVNPCC